MAKTKINNIAGSEKLNKLSPVQNIGKKLSGLSIQTKEKPTNIKKKKPKNSGTCGVDKLKRLKTLSPDHIFTEDDFTAILRTFGYVRNYGRKEKEIEWSKT